MVGDSGVGCTARGLLSHPPREYGRRMSPSAVYEHTAQREVASLDFRFIRLFGEIVDCEVLTLWGGFGVVEGEESFLQVVVVSVAVGSFLRGSDYVVDAFERAG